MMDDDMTTWRKMIDDERAERDDKSPVVSCTLTDAEATAHQGGG